MKSQNRLVAPDTTYLSIGVSYYTRVNAAVIRHVLTQSHVEVNVLLSLHARLVGLVLVASWSIGQKWWARTAPQSSGPFFLDAH